MTITSPLELSVSNQGTFNVSRISGRSALVLNLGAPSISHEWLKLELSNFVRWFATWRFSIRITNCPLNGCGHSHVILAGASTWTPLREITALSQTSSWWGWMAPLPPEPHTALAIRASLCRPSNINPNYGLGFVWIPWVALRASGGDNIGGSNPLTSTQLIMALPLKALSPWLWHYHFWRRLHCSNYLVTFRQPKH